MTNLNDRTISKPQYLYKYFRPSDQNFRALENRQLYFPKPEKFDDPYDCKIQFPPPNSAKDFAILAGLDEEMKRTGQMPVVDKNKINDWNDKFQQQAERNLNQIKSTVSKLYAEQRARISQWGIASFTERGEDMMMFSLYADHHKGFCLEFDTDDRMFDHALKVEYQAQISQIDIEAEMLDGETSVKKLLTTKSPSWECEREWRIPHDPGNVLVSYNPDCLTAVHLGLNLDDFDEQRIKRALEIKGSRTRLFRMKISPADFRLVKDAIWLKR